MHGILLIDKPVGMSSHDVVGAVRSMIRPVRVGHTGTLDPAASGLLVLMIGSATRILDYLDESMKAYTIAMLLGQETDSCDADGAVVAQADPSHITEEQVRDAIQQNIGILDQIPPHFSAIKKNGKPLYKYARKGIFPEVQARKVQIFSLVLRKFDTPFIELDLLCSKGTYARSIARDIGRQLGVFGRLDALRRTRSGRFDLDDAVPLEQIKTGGKEEITKHLLTIDHALSHIPEIILSPNEMKKLVQGSSVSMSQARIFAQIKTNDQRFDVIRASDSSSYILMRPHPRNQEVVLQPLKVLNLA